MCGAHRCCCVDFDAANQHARGLEAKSPEYESGGMSGLHHCMRQQPLWLAPTKNFDSSSAHVKELMRALEKA